MEQKVQQPNSVPPHNEGLIHQPLGKEARQQRALLLAQDCGLPWCPYEAAAGFEQAAVVNSDFIDTKDHEILAKQL